MFTENPIILLSQINLYDHTFEREIMSKTVSVAEMKSHLSEYISKSTYKNERFIITRRNKKVDALVNIDDLQLIEQEEERLGLASLIGKWKKFDEIEKYLKDVPSLRKRGGSGRDVSL